MVILLATRPENGTSSIDKKVVSQKEVVMYWYGNKVEKVDSYESEFINATFANYYLEYEILTYLDPERCSGKKLFVFVMSAVHYFDQRDIIRNTWAKKEHNNDSLVVFIVGLPKNKNDAQMLREEVILYNDVIETTIPDTYNYTAFKIHAGYNLHVRRCSDVPFVLRADDDIITLPDRLVHFIDTGYFGNEDKAIYGTLVQGVGPIRDPNHKWYIPKEYYGQDQYPPYVNGPAYLMTQNSTKAILEKTNVTTFFWIEDVLFTGLMADKTNVKLINSYGIFAFHCYQKDDAGRRAFNSLDRAGYCLRSTLACDQHGVPYATIIFHYPDFPRSNIYHGYEHLTSVKCDKEIP
uniref:Hexosyltransferase n=1 Tax=Steinernema glaseri TaxID=37863 RepID=A0A1I8AHV0_9BILA